jgi:hypothetical protein
MATIKILVLLFAMLAAPQDTHYNGPNALGPFRIDRDVTMKTLFQILGSPRSTKSDSFCYKAKDGKASLVLTRMVEAYDDKVAGVVVLADFPNCIDTPVEPTSANLSAWKTEKGIGLGSSMDDVRRAYGTETARHTIEGNDYLWIIQGTSPLNNQRSKALHAELGDTALVFEGSKSDLKSTTFGFLHDRVIWIAMSKNE